MSKNEWERGTLKIPAKAWKPLRDGLAAAFNDRQKRLYELALQLHAKMVETKKSAKRGAFNAQVAWNELVRGRSWPVAVPHGGEADLIESSILGPFGKRTGAIYLPKLKDFPLAIPTKAVHYEADLGTISLNHKTNELRWDVEENNHAVESSRESYMGVVLFKLLDKVEWTRGTGGEFVGNDEYNCDSDHDGGGANYVTATYRMKTKAELEAEARHRRLQFGIRSTFGSIGYRR